MADKDFALQVTNGSKDLQTIEDFVNLPEGSQVKPRLLPSVDVGTLAGIRGAIFKAGGLPATPFRTKALMSASSLANDKYAMVTDDAVAENNGVYVKGGGVWSKTKYDPLKESINYTDSKIDSVSKNAESIEIKEESRGQYSTSGAFISDLGISTSNSIPVKAGECYVLVNMQESITQVNTFSLFDSANNFVANLASARVQANYYDKPQAKMELKAGLYNREESLFTSGVVIPEDGFIKVSYKTNGNTNPFNKLDKKVSLYKTDFKSFLKLTAIQAPFEVLSKFEGILNSPKIDKALPNNGSIRFAYSTDVGAAQEFASGSYYISEKIAVKAGQYLHLHTMAQNDFPLLSFEDASGNYLGTHSIINEYTVGMGVLSTVVPLNVKSEFTGFVRVQMYNLNSVPLLFGVSDNAINHPKNYLTKETESLVFNPSLGNNSTEGFRTTTFNNATIRGVTRAIDSDISQYTASIPYVLKKGDVLEYELDATSSPLLAMIATADKQFNSPIFEFKEELALRATEVVSLEQKRKQIVANNATTPLFYEDARKGTIAYCNEDTDILVIFFRPLKKSATFRTFKQSEGYKVSIYSKEEYKLKRNKELAERFKMISAFMVRDTLNNPFTFTNEFQGRGTFPAVLMFKGEVMNYQSSGFMTSTVVDLENIDNAKPKGQIIGDIGDSTASIYTHTSTKNEMMNLPIRASNPLSTFINQIYAHKTTLVYPSVNYFGGDGKTELDVESIIKDVKFAPKIIDLKDAVIGKNLVPFKGIGLSAIYFNADSSLNRAEGVYISLNTLNDVLFSFAPKDTSVEYACWGYISNRTLNVGAIKPQNTANLALNNMRPVMNYPEKDGTYFNYSFEGMNSKAGYTLLEDSLVSVTTDTASRDRALMSTDGSQEALNVISTVYPMKLYTPDTYEFSLKTIPNAKVLEEYTVTNKAIVEIPNLKGLSINFCTLVSTSLDDDLYSLVQIKVGNKVMGVFHCKTANQGQSSAGSFRKNVNMKFYNDKMKKVKVRFGNTLALSDFVLKSYYNSDKGHFKDTVTTDLWYRFRKAEPFPRGGVLPKEIFIDTTFPENQLARASTFAFPVEHHRGGKFYGLGTVRYKKRNENYGMDESNPNHILIQLDWQALGSAMDWKDTSIANFEIRSPDIDDYTSGDTVLPPEYKTVEDSVKRIADWMREVYLGTVDARATYTDYVNLESLLDYCLIVLVSGNPDATRNNFMMGTHDNTHWHFYSYDSDKSWGAASYGAKIPYTFYDSNQFFNEIGKVFAYELGVRYRRLRNLGIINTRFIQDLMLEQNSYMSATAKKIDAKYWGEIFEAASVGYSMDWTYKRINYLDSIYNYIEKDNDIVLQVSIPNNMVLTAGQVKTTSYTDRPVKTTDNFVVEMGDDDLKDTSLTVTCSVDGTLEVTHTNPKDSKVSLGANYLRVYKV